MKSSVKVDGKNYTYEYEKVNDHAIKVTKAPPDVTVPFQVLTVGRADEIIANVITIRKKLA